MPAPSRVNPLLQVHHCPQALRYLCGSGFTREWAGTAGPLIADLPLPRAINVDSPQNFTTKAPCCPACPASRGSRRLFAFPTGARPWPTAKYAASAPTAASVAASS
ncbi:hypothetical protein EFK07_06740 [Pseudomonas putida]|uniref:Uncharacterized protein n=1 Tax=Pseudomonas putida TaxID=303 RepID=A0A3M8TGD3_PSEPU|nr:hypothetical protein EFK07_06740 [Pseudomonas putida]